MVTTAPSSFVDEYLSAAVLPCVVGAGDVSILGSKLALEEDRLALLITFF